MTNALQTISRNRTGMPSVFRSSFWDDFWGDWRNFEKALSEKGQTPCDISTIKDENGKIL